MLNAKPLNPRRAILRIAQKEREVSKVRYEKNEIY